MRAITYGNYTSYSTDSGSFSSCDPDTVAEFEAFEVSTKYDVPKNMNWPEMRRWSTRGNFVAFRLFYEDHCTLMSLAREFKQSLKTGDYNPLHVARKVDEFKKSTWSDMGYSHRHWVTGEEYSAFLVRQDWDEASRGRILNIKNGE